MRLVGLVTVGNGMVLLTWKEAVESLEAFQHLSLYLLTNTNKERERENR